MTTPDSYPLDTPAAYSADEIAAAWTRERPSAPVESITVVTPLWRVAKLLADDRRRELARAGVDAATMDLLSTLRRAGPPYTLSTRELTARTLVTAGAVSQRVARAESEGLVQRRRPESGGRTVLVELTDSGHACVEAAVDQILTRECELLGGLSDQQRRQLGDLLSHLLHDVQSRLSGR